MHLDADVILGMKWLSLPEYFYDSSRLLTLKVDIFSLNILDFARTLLLSEA